MKNEALRLFLAITALILTALLTNPASNTELEKPAKAAVTSPKKKLERKTASSNSHKSSRNFAFFFRR